MFEEWRSPLHSLVVSFRGDEHNQKSPFFCNNFVEKFGDKTKIYSRIYKELVTSQMALRHSSFKACEHGHFVAYVAPFP